MKNRFLILVIFCVLGFSVAQAQTYNPVNYNFNGTPTYGVKIKTNIPFTPTTQMPTIIIEGYNYGTTESIGLILSYYTYSTEPDFHTNSNNFTFYHPSISSFGAYTPDIYLASENGKVIIYLDQKEYYQRFTVRCFAQGMNEQSAWFQGWSVVDEPNNGVKSFLVPYKNKFKGEVIMPGNGIWNENGNVGIGTTTPTSRLAVNGNIRAREIKVENANWPDFVFAKAYTLPTLQETEAHIKAKGHLPGIPSAAEVKSTGVDLGDMNAKLLQKIEELMLYTIEQTRR